MLIESAKWQAARVGEICSVSASVGRAVSTKKVRSIAFSSVGKARGGAGSLGTASVAVGAENLSWVVGIEATGNFALSTDGGATFYDLFRITSISFAEGFAVG